MHNDWNEYYSGILRHLQETKAEPAEHKLGRLLEYVSRESLSTFKGEELRILGESNEPDFIVKDGNVYMAYNKEHDPDQATLRRFLKMKAWQAGYRS